MDGVEGRNGVVSPGWAGNKVWRTADGNKVWRRADGAVISR